MPLEFRGPIADFLNDTTREVDCEGGLSSGKTTAALWKIRHSCKVEPRIEWFAARYSDSDTQQKLRPAFEKICDIYDPNDIPAWDTRSKAYVFENRSSVAMFGLKAPDVLSRYAKMRGLGAQRIYIDQAEELPKDVAKELRARLRRSIDDTVPDYPHQLIFTPNPMDRESWLAKEFPDGSEPAHPCPPGRKYYAISLFDNQHNLHPDTIKGLLTAFPEDHAKYRSVILGKRGVNVTGDPIYEGSFSRKIHWTDLAVDFNQPLYCAITCGKSHPTAVFMQQPYAGGMHCLAGMLGVSLFLDDFLPMLLQQIERWFGKHPDVRLCTDGSTDAQDRYTLTQLIRSHKMPPMRQRANSNAPDVRLAMIERIAAYMRRRNPDGKEAFAIDSDPSKWLRVTRDGLTPEDFVTDALEAGYVWSEHTVSVANKEIRQPLADNRHEHPGFCLELLEANFGANQLTQEQRKELQARRVRPAVAPQESQGDMAWAR